MSMSASFLANLLTLIVIICGIGFIASWAYGFIHLAHFMSAGRRRERQDRAFRGFMATWLISCVWAACLFAAAYALTLT